MTNSRTIAAVLFDLDDTLHDDTKAQLVGARLVAADVARLHPDVAAEKIVDSYIAAVDTFWKTIGLPPASALGDVRAKMWGRALADVGIADDGSLAQTCGRLYNEYRRDRLVVFPETLGLLGDLRTRGVKIGMITNGLAETHRDKIALLKLESIFDLVFIADEVGYMKPDERVFLLACERLELPPHACAMVGDRYDRDIRTPHALGMFTIWTNVRAERVPPNEPSPDADVPDARRRRRRARTVLAATSSMRRSSLPRRSASLLIRNPLLLVPSLAIGAVAGLLEATIAPRAPDDLPTSHAQLWLADGIGIAGFVIALAVTTGMADGAWKSGRARLADAAIALRRKRGHVAAATIVMGLLGFVAAMLAPYTAFLSLLVWAYFSMYTISAAVIGEREGFVALRESAIIAYSRPLATGFAIAASSCVLFCATLAGAALSDHARIGAIVAAIIAEAPVAYLSLAAVGECETLRTV